MWPWSSNEEKLRRASRKGGVATVRKLLETGDLDLDARDDKNCWSALHFASREGNVQIVELLLKANASVDATSPGGKTPLHHASEYGRAQVVAMLVEANADVNAKDTYGMTPLHFAVGSPPVVEVLLNVNATVDARDEDGRTPLHHASEYGRAEVVEMLLKANATITVADNRGQTPLHKACKSHEPHVARIVLAAGANLYAKDEDNLKPLHSLMKPWQENGDVTSNTLETLQVLVIFGATWDALCDEIVAAGKAWVQASAIALCMSLWTQEHADGLPLTDISIEVVKRGVQSTQTYIESLRASDKIVFRRKICLVGASCAGKTSFVKSITAKEPQLVHLVNRTIGIDHFPLRFGKYVTSRAATEIYTEIHQLVSPEYIPTRYRKYITSRAAIDIHEVTFWDFAGQDAYQVAHSLFFSPRTLFLVCIDLEAFTVAYLQASIMSDIKKQETQLMDEFIERTVMQWVRMIIARQPDAEFVFLATKEDLLAENSATEQLLKSELQSKLKEVEASTQEMKYKLVAKKAFRANANAVSTAKPNVVFVSCISSASVQRARGVVEDLIAKSDRSFQMPDAYTQALQVIVELRASAEAHDITTRINRVFASVDQLPTQLNLKPDLCRFILQTLHDLGDVLWYEDLGVELFQDRVILDPLLMIDFIRQVINHHRTGQTMPHTDLKALPYWNGFSDKEQMKAMKQVLQKFHLVYSADEDRTMSWDSDLIVPAYWQTKTPASWLFLGDVLRINDTRTFEGEAARVEWEYHFDFGLPASLFDHLVVASVSPFFTFDAGPDWIVHEEKDIAACRIMVGRDVKSLHRTMHVEAVVSETATTKQVEMLWSTFQHLVGAFVGVLREYPGSTVSSFAWDDAKNKVGFNRLLQLRSNALPITVTWMPPADTWASIKVLMLKKTKTKSDK